MAIGSHLIRLGMAGPGMCMSWNRVEAGRGALPLILRMKMCRAGRLTVDGFTSTRIALGARRYGARRLPEDLPSRSPQTEGPAAFLRTARQCSTSRRLG